MPPAHDRTEPRRRWIAAGVCALAGVLLFQFFGNATRGYVDTSSMWWWWASQWLNPDAETQHGWLILALSGWLLARNLKPAGSPASRAESREPRRGTGVLAMIAALALHALGFAAQQTRLSIVASLLFLWGVARFGGGRRWGSAALFPVAFMLFAIPVNVLDSLGFWLRMGVVNVARDIAQAFGIGVIRSGTQLFAPDGRYQYDVAAACSGVRSLVALAALSLLIGYLRFRSGWRRAAVFALCLPLTYLGNLLRVLAIVFAAEIGGQRWGERTHEVMGFGVFVIVLGGVMGGARLLQRVWPERQAAWMDGVQKSEAGIQNSEIRSQAPGFGTRFVGRVALRFSGSWIMDSAFLISAAVVTLVAVEMVFLARVAERPVADGAGVRLSADGRDPIDLPAFVGTEWIGRRSEVTAVEREVLPADTGFSRRNYVHVQGGAHTVFFSIVLSGRDRTSIHRPELCLVGQGWTIAGRSERWLRWADAPAAKLPATVLRTTLVEPRSGRQVPALTVYWFVNRDVAVASHWERIWHDAWNRLRHARADRWAYVLMQTDAADGEEAALARMESVLAEVWPAVSSSSSAFPDMARWRPQQPRGVRRLEVSWRVPSVPVP